MPKIYESPDKGQTVYEREFESASGDRVLIKDNRTVDGRPLHEHIMESKLWGDIHRLSRTHAGLQAELERVIIFYNLIKDDNR
jgi:hypothetical protein